MIRASQKKNLPRAYTYIYIYVYIILYIHINVYSHINIIRLDMPLFGVTSPGHETWIHQKNKWL